MNEEVELYDVIQMQMEDEIVWKRTKCVFKWRKK